MIRAPFRPAWGLWACLLVVPVLLVAALPILLFPGLPARRAAAGLACRAQRPTGVGHQISLLGSSSMFTSLNVSTRTFLTKRAGRYMSQTQASDMRTSK